MPFALNRRKTLLALIFLAGCSPALAAETRFERGPQEFAGTRYYWLAEWKLEVTLPDDVALSDRFEVLFGSEGAQKRTLHFEYRGKSGSLGAVYDQPYQWVAVPIGPLVPAGKVVQFGKGRADVAFVAGVRVVGKSQQPLKIAARSTTGTRYSGDGIPFWSDLPGFKVNQETQRLWDPAPRQLDWKRAERSARYAGIALRKVQRWLHERVRAVHDKKTGLFRPTGPVWNYWDTAADCYPFYVWAAWFTDQKVLDTVMRETLEAEQRLCKHLDRLPVPYNMDAGRQVEIPFDRMIFGASEYARTA